MQPPDSQRLGPAPLGTETGGPVGQQGGFAQDARNFMQRLFDRDATVSRARDMAIAGADTRTFGFLPEAAGTVVGNLGTMLGPLNPFGGLAAPVEESVARNISVARERLPAGQEFVPTWLGWRDIVCPAD